jgi:hypothetical protein
MDQRREMIKDLSRLENSLIEFKKTERFVPNMIKQRFKPAYDGAYQKFKQDKTTLQKIGLCKIYLTF